MAGPDIFAALQSLSPTSHSALPSAHTLPGYLSDCLRDARVLTSSLPSLGDGSSGQEWKTVKLSARENPMGFGVFKLTAKDGKGAWFARRSVHDGVGFARFRRGLEKEFEAGEGRGIGEGRGSVRGIGRERRLERETCEIGKIEVNYLSAQFPGPSAPRDFVAACLTSPATPHDGGDDVSEPPTSTRQFAIISRPILDHPECPNRQGYVRGQYESLEFIREIPAETNPTINRREGGVSTAAELKRVHSVPNLTKERDPERCGRRRGKTITSPDRGSPGEAEYSHHPSFDSACSNLPAEDPEENPVEWIMITRSDPGGSVPRWMVERGTPGSIVKDAEKFLDWVAWDDGLAIDYFGGDADTGVGAVESEGIADGATPERQKHKEDKQDVKNGVGLERSEAGGLLTSVTNTTSAGVTAVTPPLIYTPGAASASSSRTLPTPALSSPRRASSVSGSDGDSDASSLATFTTAPPAYTYPDIASLPSSSASSSHNPHNHYHPSSAQEERALSRLLRDKSKLSARLEKQVEKEEKRRTKDKGQEQKLLEKHIKDVEKREEKYRRDIEKAKRKEDKRERKDGWNEVRELKNVVEGLTRENLDLRSRVQALEGKDAEREKNTSVAKGV